MGPVHQVDFPVLPVPDSILDNGKYPNMVLKLHFLSAMDAAEAMRNPAAQTISVRAVEEYWDVCNAEIGFWAVEHVLVVKPRRFVPGSIFGRYGAAIYRVPTESEQEPHSNVKPPNYRDEVEPLSFEQTAHSGYPVCEYDVSYYAAYSDGEKLWEVCPKKQLYTIGGTQYQFPNNE